MGRIKFKVALLWIFFVFVFFILKNGDPAWLQFNEIETGPKWRSKMQVEQQHRRLHTQKACQLLGNSSKYASLDEMNSSHLLWLMRRRMMTCINNKVGSTWWVNLLLQDYFDGEPLLTAYRSPHYIAETVLGLSPTISSFEIPELLESVRSVIIVRHPFVRLVSAYRDKIESCVDKDDCYAYEFGFTRESVPRSFSAFVEFLIRIIPESGPFRGQLIDDIDSHWLPYYINCAPCDIKYDFTVKMESWQDDVRFVLENFNFTSFRENERINASNATHVALEYFKDVEPHLISSLYSAYFADFEMFGYSPNGFYNIYK
ncbi:carbohydrate sulfotransferase 8 isoform X4 [Hyalella azteca]|uniref:Carbohydrate sulfotransferase n=1 Tax=Hyalella azteca TaxID=294128 RepID=A0A8B7N989_HYAAZ|nr:carbohydrate sulfotransferase 8 isoform X4 [Hyalella azteca]